MVDPIAVGAVIQPISAPVSDAASPDAGLTPPQPVTDVLAPTEPVTALHGVGPGAAAKLAAAQLASVRDLLGFFPRRLDAVVDVDDPADEQLGVLVRIRGAVTRTTKGWLPGRRCIVTVTMGTASGAQFRVVFFNQPYLAKSFPVGAKKTFEGTLDKAGSHYKLVAPRVLTVGYDPDGECVMRYPEIAGISESRLRAWIEQALSRVDRAALAASHMLPPSLRDVGAESGSCVAGEDAIAAMHLPKSLQEHEAARLHFALLEAVALFRGVERARRQRGLTGAPAIDRAVAPRHAARIAAVVPFDYTTDQQRAAEVLRAGLASSEPLGVLLHGDVGTGKTAVVLDAAVAVADAGYQIAFLAPTELLAEQHATQLKSWLSPAGIRCELLLGSLDAESRRAVDRRVSSGDAQIVVGTHALFSESTTFAKLGLVLIDEQHRFGVEQRNGLVAKGVRSSGGKASPHVVVMSATPIPRTLTLARFGDLDTVVLHERPRGRRMPKAVFVAREGWQRIVHAIRRHLRRNGSVYVVCPRVGEDGELGGAVRVHQELEAQLGSSGQVGLVHGRQRSEDRQVTTAAFRAGDSMRVLVGTTVLEVGVDVARATLMVVVSAERFGIATLHQLRGRVGRGERRGLCILTGSANARTTAVCSTTDGFDLAETDLKLRGAGELLGKRQSGALDFRALDPIADYEVLQRARDAVRSERKVVRS